MIRIITVALTAILLLGLTVVSLFADDYNEDDEWLQIFEVLSEDDDLIGEIKIETYSIVPNEIRDELAATIGEIDFDNWDDKYQSPSIRENHREGDILHCCFISKNSDGSFTIRLWDKRLNSEHIHEVYKAGDLNKDGNFNAKYVICLMKYIVGSNDYIDIEKADANGDGSINARDVITLMKIIVSGNTDVQAERPNREDFINAFVDLDNNTKNKIEQVFADKFGEQIKWYSSDDAWTASTWKIRCYYADDDYVILFEPTDMAVLSEEEFGDNVFRYNSSFVLWVYHTGDITTLKEAFDAGVVSSSAIGEAAQRHNTIEEYLRIIHSK